MMAMKLSTTLSQIASRCQHPTSHLPIKFRIFGSSIYSYATNCWGRLTVLDLDCLPQRSTPWLMLPPKLDKDNNLVDCFYSLNDNQVVRLNRKKCLGIPDSAKCFASTRGWLGFVEPKGECPIYLSNPFGVKDVVRLPSVDTMFRIVGLKHDHMIDYCWRSDAGYYSPYSYEMTPEQLVNGGGLSHLVLSHRDPRHESCVVVATQGGGSFDTCITYCPIGEMLKKPKNGDVSFGWNLVQPHEASFGNVEKQIIFSEKDDLFYAIHIHEGKTDVIDFHAFNLHNHNKMPCQSLFKFYARDQLEAEFKKEESEALKALRKMCKMEPYIVSLDTGEILLVARHYLEGNYVDCAGEHKTLLFDVFKVDFTKWQLERVKSLGDQTIFIGSNQSFSTKCSHGVQANSIYFTDHTHLGTYDNCELGIYNLENSSISPCYPFATGEDKTAPSSNRNKLFWLSPSSLRC